MWISVGRRVTRGKTQKMQAWMPFSSTEFDISIDAVIPNRQEYNPCTCTRGSGKLHQNTMLASDNTVWVKEKGFNNM